MPLAFIFDDNYSISENGESAPEIVARPPAISATNEHEAGRIERLHATWGQACAAVALLSHRYQNHWQGAVVGLHDHKGTLQVTWRDEQSRVMFEGVVMGAWEREGEHAGAHRLAR